MTAFNLNAFACGRLSFRLSQKFPTALPLAEKESFPAPSCFLSMTEEAGWHNLRVVQNQAVARIEVFFDVAKCPIINLPALPIQHHQPGGVARFGGRLRDQLPGKL